MPAKRVSHIYDRAAFLCERSASARRSNPPSHSSPALFGGFRQAFFVRLERTERSGGCLCSLRRAKRRINLIISTIVLYELLVIPGSAKRIVAICHNWKLRFFLAILFSIPFCYSDYEYPRNSVKGLADSRIAYILIFFLIFINSSRIAMRILLHLGHGSCSLTWRYRNRLNIDLGYPTHPSFSIHDLGPNQTLEYLFYSHHHNLLPRPNLTDDRSAWFLVESEGRQIV